jgi:hypothetical protein
MSRNRISLFTLIIYFLANFLTASALSEGSPTAPTNVKAVAHTSYHPQVVITWSQAMDNVGITRYNIYRNGTFLFSPKGVGVTYTDLDVIPGQSYTYSVQAGDGDGNNGPQSDIVQIVISDGVVSQITAAAASLGTTEPSSSAFVQTTTSVYTNTSISDNTVQITHPENVGMIAYDNQLLITWKNPKGNQFKSVRVIKKTTSYPLSTTDGSVICDGLKEQCVDKDVVSGKTYYYGVYAVDQSYLASKLISVSGSLMEKKTQTSVTQKSTAVTSVSPLVGVPGVVTTPSVGASVLSGEAVLFTKTLKLGTTGQEVLLLQKFLNTHGFVIAATGPGSSGNETTTFGKATQKAVQSYQCQKKIVCEGSQDSTGYGMVGKTTRMHLNKNSAQ